jgi:GNAT superfamily N-acetyltransferase
MAAGEVRIRRAVEGDRDAVWPLARDFATSFQPERRAFDAVFARLLARDDTLLLVAVEGDAVVGYLLASTHDTFLANGEVGWVEEVMVDPSSRRQGVGRRLMEAAESWAHETGAAYLALASRRAGPFYLALGYEDSAVFFKKTL